MTTRPRLKDRLFSAVSTLGALIILFVGFSRGNPKVAIFGALFFLGYGVLHSVTRRLTPAARLVTGHEADQAERMTQFKATQLAGQVALLIAAIGVVLELTLSWPPALWIAGSAMAVVATFVLGLWFFSPSRTRGRAGGAAQQPSAASGRSRTT